MNNNNNEYQPCQCGKGHKVIVVYPNSPGSTPCCSCTIFKYEFLYGSNHSFVVTPVLKDPNK